MVENQTLIKQKVQAFLASAGSELSIKKGLLFGSWAKGTARKDSDIDVAVVVNCDDHAKRVNITSKLFHYAFPVDSRIEPKCVFWDEYQNPDPASILSEILRTGIEVV